MADLKKCKRCGLEKELTEFFKVGGGKYWDSSCKRCRQDKQQATRKRLGESKESPAPRPEKKAAVLKPKAGDDRKAILKRLNDLPRICEDGQVIKADPPGVLRPSPVLSPEMPKLSCHIFCPSCGFETRLEDVNRFVRHQRGE